MSASLVGSEMCIRDRTIPVDIAAGTPASSASAAAPDPPPGLGVSDAVSYTHLTLPTICSV
eukprot:6310440-Alexandrium_andersonii.AAC.1